MRRTEQERALVNALTKEEGGKSSMKVGDARQFWKLIKRANIIGNGLVEDLLAADRVASVNTSSKQFALKLIRQGLKK